MKSFMSHDELARDRRFIRQNDITDVFASLPDEVDGVVEAFDALAPAIESSVAGTEFEPLFKTYGPGFLLTIFNDRLDPSKPDAELRLLMRMHGIFMGELQALEGAGRSLWDFPDSPWEFKMNMARQCWDEARHVQIYEKLLTRLGGRVGMFPESTFLFDAACCDDPAMRVAGVNRGLEGLACDVFRDMIRYAEEIGDDVMKQAIDYVLADELTHVRFGSEWVREFTKDSEEKRQACRAFQKEVDRRFSIGGTRSGREDAAIPIAEQERLEAGFTEDELDDLREVSQSGPSKETMVAAAKQLLARHASRGGASYLEQAGGSV